MQAAIGYLRVSTREQGRSGLGLAAQRLISRPSGSAKDSGQILASGRSDRCRSRRAAAATGACGGAQGGSQRAAR